MDVEEHRTGRAAPPQGLRVTPRLEYWRLPFVWAAAGWTSAVLTGAVRETTLGNPAALLALLAVGAMLPYRMARRTPLLTVLGRFGCLVGAALVVIGVLAVADPATDLTPRWRYAAMAGGLLLTRVLGELWDRARTELPLTSVYWHSQFGTPGPFALPLAPLRTIPGAKLVHHGDACLAVCGRRVAVLGATANGAAGSGWARRLPRRADVRRFAARDPAAAPVGAVAAWLSAEAGTVDSRVLAAAISPR